MSPIIVVHNSENNLTVLPHDTSLSANVQVVDQWYAMCYIKTISTTQTTSKHVKLTISAETELPSGFKVKAEGETGYQYTDENGQVWSASITRKWSSKIPVEGLVVDKTASKTGGSDWSTACAEIRSFSMEGCDLPAKQLSFSTRDCTLEELGITSYSDLYRY